LPSFSNTSALATSAPELEKKKPTESPSALEKPAALSVAGLRPMVPSSASIAAKKAEPLISKKQESSVAPQQNVSVMGSQGKLLIPEKKIKVPAVKEKVTTYSKVPNAPKVDKELMLDALALHETGTKPGSSSVGMRTQLVGPTGKRGSATGSFQIVNSTLKGLYDRNKDFKEEYNDFEEFKNDFKQNPSLERRVARFLIDQYDKLGIHALGAWYSPDLAVKAASGSKSAYNVVPGRDYGNKKSYGQYFKSITGIYQKLYNEKYSKPKGSEFKEVSKEVVKEPAVEVPSLEKFNVLSPTWYNPDIDPKVDVKETVKNLTLKNKQLTSNYKQYKKGKDELNAEIEQLNLLSRNPANRPLVLAKQKEIETRGLQLDNIFKQLSSEAEQAKDDEASLNKAMVRNAADKAKQGSWGGAIWNSFVEGYKSAGRGAVRNTSNAMIELFDAIGLPYASDKKMTKDEAKKSIINEFIPIIEKGYDVAKSKGTTNEFIAAKQEEGYIPKALLGLAQSAPIMASGGYGSFVNGALQTYDGVVRGMDDDPFTATMTENEKNTVAMPIALIGGILENYGFRTVLGKNKPALFKFSSYVISKLPKNAGIQAITNVVETAAKSKIGKAILAGSQAYLGEAETGGAQSLAEVGIKELYDQVQGVDLFKSPELFKDIAYKALEDAHVEGLGGLMMKGMAGGIQMTVGGVKGKMDDASYKLWSDMMNDEDQVSIYKAQIQTDLTTNKITKEEAQQRMDQADTARGILSQIPTDLSTRNQREAFALIAEKQLLTASIAGKDPSLVSKQSDRIKQIDEQLKQISNAVQEQTTSQVPIQPETGAGVQVAQGESQAEPQVPTQEGQRQEIEDIERRRSSDISEILLGDNESGYNLKKIIEIHDKYDAEIAALKSKVPAEEGQGQEVIAEPGIAAVDITTPTKFEEGQMPEIPIDQIDWEASGLGSMQEAIDMFGGINDITVVDIQGKNDKGQYVGNVRVLGQDTSKEGLIVFKDPNAPVQEVVEPEAPKTRADKVKQMLSDKGVYPIGTRVDGLSKLSDENPGTVTGEQVLEVLNVSTTKANTIATALNNQVKQEAKQAEKETKQAEKEVTDEMDSAVNTAIETAKSEGLTNDLAAEAGIEALKNTNAYNDADQQQRDVMEDNVRKKAGIKSNAAPSVKKILGITDTKKLVNVMAALKDQIRLEVKAAREGARSYKNTVKELLNDIKSLGKSGNLTGSQVRALINTFGGNLDNTVIRDRAFARAQRIIENAQYADKVEKANSIRAKLKKMLSADKKKKPLDQLQASKRDMIQKFVKIAPKMVDNIDQYLEFAEQVDNAVKNMKITETEIEGRIPADILAVNEYSNNEYNKQEQARVDERIEQYKYLEEAGLIDSGMSLKEIDRLIGDIIDSGQTPSKGDKLNQAGLVYYGLKFKEYAEIIKKMLSGTDPITGESIEISEGDKEILKKFLTIDPDNVDNLQTLFGMADAAQEFITNGIIDKVDAMTSAYEGIKNVKSDAANPAMRAFKAVLPWVATVSKIPIFSRLLSQKVAPVQEYLRNIFRSDKKASIFEKNSGFTGIMNGFTKALSLSNSINDQYFKLFEGKKPNGKEFNTAENSFERGIFADLYRTMFGTDAQIQKEFDRKKKQLELTINELLGSSEKAQVKEGEILSSIYDKIKDAKNIKEVEKAFDKINIEAAKWWESTWENYYDQVDRVAKSVYNVKLEKENHYTSETWRKFSKEATQTDDMLGRSLLKMNTSYVDTRRAGTLMEYSRSEGLPTTSAGEISHIKSYDFDFNQAESFKKTITDIYTAPHIVQYVAYTSSPDFKTIIADKDTRELTREKMDFAINAMKDRQIDDSSKFYREWNKYTKNLTDIGRAQALASLKAPILQTVPVIWNTFTNLVNDPIAVVKGMALMVNMDAQRALSEAGYGISVRGLEAVTALGAAENVLKASTVSGLNPLEPLKKISNETLKYTLSKPDVAAARFAWFSFYLHKLNQMGIDTKEIDWKNHEFVDEAANYAERKVNSKLNQSVQELSGELFASKKQSDRAIRNMLLSFASYSYNLKYRFWTDMTILGSNNSNLEEKADAAKDIVATVGEGAVYATISTVISDYMFEYLLKAAGYNEPEEDEKKRKDNLVQTISTRAFTDLFSPMPGLGDRLFVNRINEWILGGEQEIEKEPKVKVYFANMHPKEEKEFRFYEPAKTDDWEAAMRIFGGIPGIYGANIANFGSTLNAAYGGKKYKIAAGEKIDKTLGLKDKFGSIDMTYEDQFGKKIKFTDREKERMEIPAIVQGLSVLGIGFRDQAEFGNKFRKITEKKAKSRTKREEAKKIFFSKPEQ
jgi:hypothetical protein